jgi:hypothetical protein
MPAAAGKLHAEWGEKCGSRSGEWEEEMRIVECGVRNRSRHGCHYKRIAKIRNQTSGPLQPGGS